MTNAVRYHSGRRFLFDFGLQEPYNAEKRGMDL